MKHIAFAIGLGLVLASSSAEAQMCCTSSTDTSTALCSSCLYIGSSISLDPSCDSKDKTPSESVACKLKYWQNEVARLQKDKAELETKINHAQERVSAFTEAQRH